MKNNVNNGVLINSSPAGTGPVFYRIVRRRYKAFSLYFLLAIILLGSTPLQAQHYKYLRYRISPYERDQLKACHAQNPSDISRCKYDTFRYSGHRLYVFGITGGIPRNEYARYNRRQSAWGIEFLKYSYHPFEKIPASIGAGFRTLYTGLENHDTDMQVAQVGEGSQAGSAVTPVTVSSKNNLFTLNAHLRLWVPLKYVQPYVELESGWLFPGTSVRLYEQSRPVILGWKDNGLLYNGYKSPDDTWNRCLSAGLGINVDNWADIDIKITWLKSGTISYYDRTDVLSWKFKLSGNGGLDFETPPPLVRSPVNLLLLTVGLNVFIVP